MIQVVPKRKQIVLVVLRQDIGIPAGFMIQNPVAKDITIVLKDTL